MKEHLVSKAYAQALYGLGKDSKVDVTKELTSLTEVINENNSLETVLYLDVFTLEEKTAVLNDVVGKMKLSPLVKNFISFLIQEKRLGLFPTIFKDMVVMDDHDRGFLRGRIEGSDDKVSDDFKAKLKTYLEDKIGKKTELEYVKNESITAGYRVTVEDLQLDASLDNQLDKLKNDILNA